MTAVSRDRYAREGYMEAQSAIEQDGWPDTSIFPIIAGQCTCMFTDPEDVVATVELTKDNFEQIVMENELVLIDYWASWCGPCKSFAPVFEAASEKYPEIVFAKVNTEEQQELAAHFQIRSIPTLMIFREKIIIFSQPGMIPSQALDELIDRARELDMEQVRKDIEAQHARA